MKTLEEITKEITNSLQSNVWKELKTSLLGKELISYAAQTIYKNELGRNSILQGLQASSMDESAYYGLAHACDVALYRRMPSVLRVKITVPHGIIRPYQVSVTVGTSTFYNIDFVEGDEVNLYQGVLRTCKSSEDIYEWGVAFRDEAWEEFSEFTTSAKYSKYVKLSEYAYPDSVRVMENDGSYSYPLTWYQPFLAHPDAKLFKVRVVRDGKVGVVFGNGIWAKVLNTPYYKTQIFYLDATVDPFDADSITQVSVSNISTGEASKVPCEIVSVQEGYDCSVKDLQNQLISGNAEVVSSKDSIIRYMNGFPFVVDTQVVSNGTSNLLVYIKPVVNTTGSLSDLQANLQAKADACTLYQVKLADYIILEYVVRWKGINQSDRLIADRKAREELAYENTGFNTDFSVAAVSAILRKYTSGYLYVLLKLKEKITSLSGTFLSPPSEGTLKIPYKVANTGYKNALETRYAEISSTKVSELSEEFALNEYTNIVIGEYAIYEKSSVFTAINVSAVAERKSSTNKVCLNDLIPELGGMTDVKCMSDAQGFTYLYSFSSNTLKVVAVSAQDFTSDTIVTPLQYRYYEISDVPVSKYNMGDYPVEDYCLAEGSDGKLYFCVCLIVLTNEMQRRIVSYALDLSSETCGAVSAYMWNYSVADSSPLYFRMEPLCVGVVLYSNIVYSIIKEEVAGSSGISPQGGNSGEETGGETEVIPPTIEYSYSLSSDGNSLARVFTNLSALGDSSVASRIPILRLQCFGFARRVLLISSGGESYHIHTPLESLFRGSLDIGSPIIEFSGAAFITYSRMVIGWNTGCVSYPYTGESIDLTRGANFSEYIFSKERIGKVNFNTGGYKFNKVLNQTVEYESNGGLTPKDGKYYELDTVNPFTWEEIE